MTKASHLGNGWHVNIAGLGTITRLGLATRGNTRLETSDVYLALDRGVNYWNWCGHADGMQRAIRELGPRRRDVFIAVQLSARTATHARRELKRFLCDLGTDYIDVVTYYYVEDSTEWQQIVSSNGAAAVLEQARRSGMVRSIGVTSHQRPLARRIADSGAVDLVMVRYNAAHRGCEQDVFPVTARNGLPVVAFTCLRWGALLRPTPGDPPRFRPPPAPLWYRFVLTRPEVSIALMAPNGAAELEENLSILSGPPALDEADYARLAERGQQVRRFAGHFP